MHANLCLTFKNILQSACLCCCKSSFRGMSVQIALLPNVIFRWNYFRDRKCRVFVNLAIFVVVQPVQLLLVDSSITVIINSVSGCRVGFLAATRSSFVENNNINSTYTKPLFRLNYYAYYDSDIISFIIIIIYYHYFYYYYYYYY